MPIVGARPGWEGRPNRVQTPRLVISSGIYRLLRLTLLPVFTMQLIHNQSHDSDFMQWGGDDGR